MTARIFTIVTLPFLMACTGLDQEGDPNILADRGETSLAGNWQVAAIDGKPIVGVALTGTDAILGWAPSCAGWMVRYQQSGKAIVFSRTANTGQITTACAVGYPDKLPQIFGVLPDMKRIEAGPGGQLRLSGNGHSLTLERPVSHSEMAVPTLQGTWRVSSLDGNTIPEGAGLNFVADENMISWTVRCAQQARVYYIENDRFVAREPQSTIPPPPPPLQVPRPICAIGLPPHLEGAFEAIDAAVKISRSKGSGIKLEGGGRTLTFYPVNIELEVQP